MIPVRLELCNFLSYAGPVEVDFTSFDVACLTGDNGAGKSALLDAITYAVWGCARGCEGGLNHDRLVRDGTDEMYVDFTFLLEDQTYRIVRKRTAGKGGEVHFLAADGERWKNRAEGTTRETDAHIESTLRMNYETFTASAFFVQGRTDDFLRMPPGKRREVFAQLLDLGTYEKLAEAARQRSKEAEIRRNEHAATVARLAGSRADLADALEQLRAAEEAAAAAARASAAADDQLTSARALVAQAEKAEAVLQAERARLEAASESLREVQEAAETKRAELARIDGLLARTEEVEAAVAEAERLRSQEEVARAEQRAAAELERSRTEILGRIEAERRALETSRQSLGSRAEKLRASVDEVEELESKLVKIEDALDGFGDPKAATQDVRAQIGSHEKDVARLDEQLRSGELRMAEIAEKIELIGAGGGECPVCGTALDPAHRKKVKRALEEEAVAMAAARDAARADRDTVNKELRRSGEELERLLAAATDQDALITSRGELRARLANATALRSELENVETELGEVAGVLDAGRFAPDLRDELAVVERSLEQTYDAEAHEGIRARLEALRPFEALRGELVASAKQRASIEAEVQDLAGRIEAVGAEVEAQRAKVDGLLERLDGLTEAKAREEEAAGESAQAAALLQQSSQAVVGLTERVEGARRLVGDLEDAEAAESALALERRRYQRLTEAFGRNGIPQRIIENERPYLEDETNRILGRLSDEPMAVHFRFQGKTKTGKDRETLDILVRPHDGEPRDFAMFSGGEAFRIAFAVRLAMSKLLVRRAGGRLETLVIDEGFGTQDPEGRERLVEAINLARAEFRKVLVITHLDDLKDQFGTQVRVTKDPAGSALDLVLT